MKMPVRRMWVLLIWMSVGTSLARTADDWVSKGQASYTQRAFDAAEKSFEEAIALNPKSADGHLWLGFTFDAQAKLVSGEAAEALSARGRDEYVKVLDLDPHQTAALTRLSMSAVGRALQARSAEESVKRIGEARDWNLRWLQAGKPEVSAYFNLGLLADLQVSHSIRDSTAPGLPVSQKLPPIADAHVRSQLRAVDLPVVDDGIQNLQAALALVPASAIAMEYLARLYTLRSLLEETGEVTDQDVKTAEEWSKKAVVTKASAVDVQQVEGSAMTARLVKRVNPAYPALARSAHVMGAVKFRALIGIDGHIESLDLISGHPLLADAARDAVIQWTYSPLVMNGKPAKMVTTITVNFELHQ